MPRYAGRPELLLCGLLLGGCATGTPPPAVATPTASAQAPPTATWTPSTTPTATTTPTPTFPADALVDADGLNLRAGPDTMHPSRDVLLRGTPVALEGRSHDDRWLAVRSPADDRGWISAEFVTLRRDLAGVPTQITPTPPPSPTPTAIPMDPSRPLVLVPPAVAQGEPVLIRLREPGAERVVALLDTVEVPLHRLDGDRWAGIIPASPDIAPGQQPVYLTVIRPGGEAVPMTEMLTLRDGHYPEETITLDLEQTPERAAWIDPAVRDGELARLTELTRPVGAERFWSGTWRAPITPTVSSLFGGKRDYNAGAYRGRHSGLDLRARMGAPIRAPARGRVVLVETFVVLGNAVWLDHGWGVYSGYGHLGEPRVAVGDWVEPGDVLGLAGASGAVTGPHLHWEVRVAGVPVHPARWLERDVGFAP